MTVIPTQSTQVAEASTVKLAEYAYAIHICECVFWGVKNSSCADEQGCRDIWPKEERDKIAFYLAEAQEEIEQELGFFVGYKWVTQERHPYTRPIQARWGHVIAGGIRGETDIDAASTVDYTSEPAIIGPIATSVTDEDEIKVYHTDTDIEVDPSEIVLSGGNVTIYIPRCRLVDPDYADNPSNGIDYNNLLYFATDVDVKRVYNDTGTQATMVRVSCNNNCVEETGDACIHVRYPRIGSVDVQMGSTLCRDSWNFAELNYYSGLEMTKQARDAIIRLAHTKMPEPPCNCSPISYYWERDRKMPDVLTRERLNNPFGLMDGAWIAWRFTQAMKLHRGGTL